MIATGTDIKPVEVVFFMRHVRSRSFFEQMKGRGVRTISATDFNAVTPDAPNKDRFVIIDAVGVTEDTLSDSFTLERQRTVSFDKLLDLVSMGNREPDVLSSLASRLARLERKLTPREQESIEAIAQPASLPDLIAGLVTATDPDAALTAARQKTGQDDPPPAAIAQADGSCARTPPGPLPRIPHCASDWWTSTAPTSRPLIRSATTSCSKPASLTSEAASMVQSFQDYIAEHRDELTALQVLYERPYRRRLRYADIKALADTLQAPPRSWTTDRLWQAYQRLDQSRVRGSGQRQLADIVSLVRYALSQTDELTPFTDQVHERFRGWLDMQEIAGRAFTAEQVQWLEAIRDHVVGSVSMEMSDFQLDPFIQRGGLHRAYTLFGDELPQLLEELNLELAA